MELLSQPLLAQINQQIYARFPDMAGASPKQKRAPSGPNIILTYRCQRETPDGLRIERVVRATVTPDGEIVKISTSR